MASSPKALTVLTAVLSVLTLVQACPIGPNDQRYPDQIVIPKLTCRAEGVFPHPRNCTWFYRCVPKTTPEHFHLYYFKCEAGTVFSNTLDQCLFPYLVRPPCGSLTSHHGSHIIPESGPVILLPARPDMPLPTGPDMPVPTGPDMPLPTGPDMPLPIGSVIPPSPGPDIPPPTGSVILPSPGQDIPPPTGSDIIPSPGPDIPPPTGSDIIPTPESDIPPPTGSDITEPQGSDITEPQGSDITPAPTRPIRPTPPRPIRPAPPRPLTPAPPRPIRPAPTRPIRPAPPRPLTPAPPRPLRPAPTRPLRPAPPTAFTPAPTTSAPTDSPPQAFSIPCTFNDSECQRYEVCAPVREIVDLCMTCYVGALPIAASAMCPPGQLLNKGSKTCTSPPTASELCPQSLLLRDNEVVTVAQQSVAVPRTLTCSQSNLRPFEPWMVSEHCTNFELCNSYGQYKETRMLCGNFYQCARTREGRWVSEMWQCFGDTLYSYQHDRCVSKPTADELCVGSSGK